MAYNGAQWDETNPTNGTLANEIDDVARDMKIGVRGRMAQEHIWPSSQAATSEAGPHAYITFQPQTATPTLPVVGTQTQCAGIYFQTNNGYIIDSAGTSRLFFQSGAGLALSSTATAGAIPVISGSGALATLAATTANAIIVSQGVGTVPKWTGIGSIFAVTSGQAGHGTTIASAGGFASAECTVFVSIADDNPTPSPWTISGGSHVHMRHQVSVDANRLVTCVMTVYDGGAVTITGTVNYLLFAVKAGA